MKIERANGLKIAMDLVVGAVWVEPAPSGVIHWKRHQVCGWSGHQAAWSRLGLCVRAVAVAQGGCQDRCRQGVAVGFELCGFGDKSGLVPPRQGTAGLQPGLCRGHDAIALPRKGAIFFPPFCVEQVVAEPVVAEQVFKG